jgi:hypothetical protein
MRIIGCDLHASQQSIAMLDRETGDIVQRTLRHEGKTVRDFYYVPADAGFTACGSFSANSCGGGRRRS